VGEAVAPGATDGAIDIAPEWRAWVTENVLRGVSKNEIVERLTNEGIDLEAAREIHRRVTSSPELIGAARVTKRARRLELILRLHREVAAQADEPNTIPRLADVDPSLFYDHYYAANRPVVLEGYATQWPAMRWTFAEFAQRFGDVEVQLTVRRGEDANYNLPANTHGVTVPLREVIERIETEPRSNDFYMIAHGRNSDIPELHRIFDDVILDDGILDPKKLRGSTALWLGPAGTLTPLHHDTSNILFVQLVGRKRFRLASPFEVDLAENAHAMYALDEEGNHRIRGAFGDSVLEKEVILEPGDALFIPVGWWHHVEALDPSISIAFNNFPPANDFDWYRPGSVT